jgi:hypothetical protein
MCLQKCGFPPRELFLPGGEEAVEGRIVKEKHRRAAGLLHHPFHQGVAGAVKIAFPKAFDINTLHQQSTCCTTSRNTKGRCMNGPRDGWKQWLLLMSDQQWTIRDER